MPLRRRAGHGAGKLHDRRQREGEADRKEKMTAMNIQSELYSAFDSDPTQITDFLQWLVSSYGISLPCNILDMGCGPGKMLAEFSKLKWPVVGMEPDQDYYKQAKIIAESHNGVIVKKGGFAEIDFVNSFDLVAAINAPFAHFLTIEERADALNKMYSALRPGGIMFIDTANFPFILKNYYPPAETSAMINGKEIKRIPEHSFDYHNNVWIHTDKFYEVERNSLRLMAEKVHKYFMLHLPEMIFFTNAAGFVDIRTYNSYASRKNERIDKNRIMISARKP